MRNCNQIILVLLLFQLTLSGQQSELFTDLEQVKSVQVAGRQGIAVLECGFVVSGSKALYKYDENWNLILSNHTPFAGLTDSLNHIGDIDVFENKIFTGCEYFQNGKGNNLQVVVYDANSLKPIDVIKIDEKSGQDEVSGIAIDKSNRIIWLSNWVNGTYLYKYSLDNGAYIGKLQLNPAPAFQQGVLCVDGSVYITADDGDAELNEHDNLYLVDPVLKDQNVNKIKQFLEFKRTGEIEGLSYDRINRKFYVLMNRGARIIKGMPVGFYDGYSEEIHEIYIYQLK